MKKTALIAFVLIALLKLSSCSKNNSNSTCNFDVNSITGKWKFDNVKDTNNTNILDKVDNCVVDMTMTYTKDSMYKSKCNNGNLNGIAYSVSIENNKYYLNIGTFKIEVTTYDCSTLTYIETINRPGKYEGKAYYTFKKI